MITELSPTTTYQYRAASGLVKCRVASEFEDGRVTMEFLTDNQWLPGGSKISRSQLLNFLNQNGGKEIPAPEGTTKPEKVAPEEAEAKPAKAPKEPRAPKPPKAEQTGPTVQELCLEALKDGPKATAEAAKVIAKPTAAVNSAMGALQRANKVTSVRQELDGKSFIVWTLAV